jgi:CheY-like chemotaxis protein
MKHGLNHLIGGTSNQYQREARPMRVLVFEDSYDVEAMLQSAGVNLSNTVLLQRWSSEDAIQHIEAFQPQVVMLDFFMPPHTGLEVLSMLNRAVREGLVVRPDLVIGISSENEANAMMLHEGADRVIIKFDLHTLSIWKGF